MDAISGGLSDSRAGAKAVRPVSSRRRGTIGAVPRRVRIFRQATHCRASGELPIGRRGASLNLTRDRLFRRWRGAQKGPAQRPGRAASQRGKEARPWLGAGLGARQTNAIGRRIVPSTTAELPARPGRPRYCDRCGGLARSRSFRTPAVHCAMQRAGSWITPKLPPNIASPRRHAYWGRSGARIPSIGQRLQGSGRP